MVRNAVFGGEGLKQRQLCEIPFLTLLRQANETRRTGLDVHTDE